MKLKNKSQVLVPELGEFFTAKLLDVCVVDGDLARIGLIKRTKQLEQCAFACAAFTHDGYNFALRDFKVYTLHHVQVSIVFM